LLKDEIGLEDGFQWVKKKAMISTAGTIAFQWVKEAGMEEFARYINFSNLPKK
jgi:hypothetical protein